MEDFGIRAGRQLCCDSENLYVYMFTVEDEIGAEYRVALFPACQDSCPEFFFTSEDYGSDFNQLTWNPVQSEKSNPAVPVRWGRSMR